MSFLGLSRGRSKKASSDGDQLQFDLLYQLVYLSAIATSGVPRAQLFRLASELPCSTSHYFYDIDRLARNMNYQYAEACRLVGEKAKNLDVKSLLLRLSSSLATGESPSDFLNREALVQAEIYENEYEGKLESLKKWVDAFIALMVSAALIVVVATISTVIYSMGTGFVVGLVVVMMAVSAMGSWIIYRTAPKEPKILTGPEAEESQQTPRRLLIILVPGALVAGALLSLSGIGLGWVLAVVGIMIIPIGMVGFRYDGLVGKLDGDISTFLRALGSTASSIGTTPVEALGRMDLRSMGNLAAPAKRLHTVLKSRVNPYLCWKRFVTETGSELIGRGVRIFADGTNFGGDAEEVGSRAAVLTSKVNAMRAKRNLVASTFTILSLGMHATIVFLLVFIIEIVDGFGVLVASAGIADATMGQGVGAGTMLSFNLENMDFLRFLVTGVIIVLSIINAITPKVTEGGYTHKFFLYLGITLLTTGASLIMAPWLATTIFDITPASI